VTVNEHVVKKKMLQMLQKPLLKAKLEVTAMGIAQWVSTMSKDTTKVGAVLIGPEGEIRMSAYNGPAIGVLDTPDKFVRPDKYMYAAHAEENIISFCAREGIRTKGCIMVVTHQPCAHCTRKMIQAGLIGVVFGNGKFQAIEEHLPFIETMCNESGFIMNAFDPH